MSGQRKLLLAQIHFQTMRPIYLRIFYTPHKKSTESRTFKSVTPCRFSPSVEMSLATHGETMKNEDWGLVGAALVITLLHELEKKEVLSPEEGRLIVKDAAELAARLERRPILFGRPPSAQKLQAMYESALKDAQNDGNANN